MDIRVGQGFDVHPWSDDPDRQLVLGGIVLPGERGLAGHSDADVVAHAAGGDGTDDAALVEALGATVVVVDGDPANFKITGPDDLVRAEVLLDRRDA